MIRVKQQQHREGEVKEATFIAPLITSFQSPLIYKLLIQVEVYDYGIGNIYVATSYRKEQMVPLDIREHSWIFNQYSGQWFVVSTIYFYIRAGTRR